MKVKINDVSKELESLRNSGKIGSPLDATLEIHVDSKLFEKLENFRNELKFIFITSNCTLSQLQSNNKSKKVFDYNYSINVEKNLNKKFFFYNN